MISQRTSEGQKGPRSSIEESPPPKAKIINREREPEEQEGYDEESKKGSVGYPPLRSLHRPNYFVLHIPVMAARIITVSLAPRIMESLAPVQDKKRCGGAPEAPAASYAMYY